MRLFYVPCQLVQEQKGVLEPPEPPPATPLIDKAGWFTSVQTTTPQVLYKPYPGLMDSWTKYKICLQVSVHTMSYNVDNYGDQQLSFNFSLNHFNLHFQLLVT